MTLRPLRFALLAGGLALTLGMSACGLDSPSLPERRPEPKAPGP